MTLVPVAKRRFFNKTAGLVILRPCKINGLACRGRSRATLAMLFRYLTMKVHIITFGCRSNQCDSRWLAQSLVKTGCSITEDVRDAELFVVNTCAVTSESERQGRQTLRRVRRENPHAVVVATGCAAQAIPAKFLSMAEIDYVADLDARGKLGELLSSLELDRKSVV